MAAATEASAVAVMFTNPLWLVKTRIQLQLVRNDAGNYRGLWDALRRIVAEEGVAGLYKGLVPALMLTSHGAVQFAAYEEMKAMCVRRNIDMVRVRRARSGGAVSV
jgi:solute carrier family 25 folate transporter 32